jgi:hypothetical protein
VDVVCGTWAGPREALVCLLSSSLYPKQLAWEDGPTRHQCSSFLENWDIYCICFPQSAFVFLAFCLVLHTVLFSFVKPGCQFVSKYVERVTNPGRETNQAGISRAFHLKPFTLDNRTACMPIKVQIVNTILPFATAVTKSTTHNQTQSQNPHTSTTIPTRPEAYN